VEVELTVTVEPAATSELLAGELMTTTGAAFCAAVVGVGTGAVGVGEPLHAARTSSEPSAMMAGVKTRTSDFTKLSSGQLLPGAADVSFSF